MVKDGKRHIDSLKDGRTVYIDGRRVADVTSDAAFAQGVATSGRFYDYQSAPENIEAMTFVSPRTGERVSRAWQLPRNHRELVE
ncbi:MAG: 4-hydroxyphenylacetate 3-monooxygenase, partial [Rhizobiales bacterium]|nr:4-hydroxyphenylacetate 3-monooxygenase [Hyphomicrobiales bacterium]